MNILHIDKTHPLLIEELNKLGFNNIEDYHSSFDEMRPVLQGIDGLVLRSRLKVDVPFMEACPSMKFIARFGVGMEYIDKEYALSKNIKLITAKGGNANAVAEHTMGLLLALTNNILKASKDVKLGIRDRVKNRGVELEGKTIGIIGYGHTGKAFAKKLHGFDVKVIFYDILPNISDEYAQQVTLNDLKKQSDIISLHVPLTPLTKQMIDRSFIKSCSKSFWLINCARGECVVTQDLIEALNTEKIRGCGLDVIEYENHSFETLRENHDNLKKILDFDQVIHTPHIAGHSVESFIKMKDLIIKGIKSL